jgi:hypothetical protein
MLLMVAVYELVAAKVMVLEPTVRLLEDVMFAVGVRYLEVE